MGGFAEFNKSEKFKATAGARRGGGEIRVEKCALRVASASPRLRVEIGRNDQVIFARRLRERDGRRGLILGHLKMA